jgi:hypothetical protein
LDENNGKLFHCCKEWYHVCVVKCYKFPTHTFYLQCIIYLKEKEAEEAEQQLQATLDEKAKYDDDDDDDDDHDESTAVTTRFSGLSTEDNENKDEQGTKKNKENRDHEQPASCNSSNNSSKAADNKEDTQLEETTENKKEVKEAEKQLDKDKTVTDEKPRDNIVRFDDDCKDEKEISACSSEMNSCSSGIKKENISLMDFSGKILNSEEFIELCQQLHHQNTENSHDTDEEIRDETPKLTTIGMVSLKFKIQP